MIKRLQNIVFILLLLTGNENLFSQTLRNGSYRAVVYREDGKEVVFILKVGEKNKKKEIFIQNATENINVKDVVIKNDSLSFQMPVFESEFKTVIQKDGSLKGTWYKATAGKLQEWPFVAVYGKPRFDFTDGNAKNNISGRWDVSITRANGTIRKAVAEFKQNGNNIIGTFLTPSGDYRYLEGIVTGNRLQLSTFDGAHAYTFTAQIADSNQVKEGFFGSGIAGVEKWEAVKNALVKLPEQEQPTQLKEGFTKLDFTFKDLAGKPVSINDERFKNKVVIIQLMGSWCPNCMDETNFLSGYYNENKKRGLEIIALAYEYSTDFNRSKESVTKFQKKFNVHYPMLITGAAISDEQRTEKTLPQLTPIKVFPTTLYLDRKGNVREIHNTFYGPGTGEEHEKFKKRFYNTMDLLLAEQ
jgi:thiol-disulfide isomerase/thioredoxin